MPLRSQYINCRPVSCTVFHWFPLPHDTHSKYPLTTWVDTVNCRQKCDYHCKTTRHPFKKSRDRVGWHCVAGTSKAWLETMRHRTQYINCRQVSSTVFHEIKCRQICHHHHELRSHFPHCPSLSSTVFQCSPLSFTVFRSLPLPLSTTVCQSATRIGKSSNALHCLALPTTVFHNTLSVSNLPPSLYNHLYCQQICHHHCKTTRHPFIMSLGHTGWHRRRHNKSPAGNSATSYAIK